MQELTDTMTAKPKQSTDLSPAKDVLARFRRSLDATAKNDQTIGLAVSGGPDSLALLLLAAAALPGKVEAATVDHGLRAGSKAEAKMVAALCKKLGVQHETLVIEWDKKPTSAIQERARARRYKALGDWAKARKIGVIATAHHAEDQAETLLMRLVRGSGVRGLAGMRARRRLPGADLTLARPLLSWTREDLAAVCAAAGVKPAVDPSNADSKFERVRVRETLAGSDWLNPLGLAKSAGFLAQADEALRWAATQEWPKRVREENAVITFDPAGLPRELSRRIVKTIVAKLETEGKGADLRGREIDQLLAALSSGKQATIRGVLCGGGKRWRFAKAPARKAVTR